MARNLSVHLHEDETVDDLIRIFKTKVKKDGILLKVRDRKYFLKTALKRKRKSERARIKNKTRRSK